jgi:hypothetical protein
MNRSGLATFLFVSFLCCFVLSSKQTQRTSSRMAVLRIHRFTDCVQSPVLFQLCICTVITNSLVRGFMVLDSGTYDRCGRLIHWESS